jgi:hypothetical protein
MFAHRDIECLNTYKLAANEKVVVWSLVPYYVKPVRLGKTFLSITCELL